MYAWGMDCMYGALWLRSFDSKSKYISVGTVYLYGNEARRPTLYYKQYKSRDARVDLILCNTVYG